jgi:hypothetical protein
MRLGLALAGAIVALLSLGPRAQALDKVHVGTAVALWAFLPLQVGDGHFDPQAIEVLKSSFVDMGILDKKPSNDDFMTTRFVPVTP